MKEFTITEEKTIKMPTNDEYAAVAKSSSPIEPKSAALVTCFVMGYDFGTEEEKAVYECLKEADPFLRNTIASEVATAYCDAHNIEWGTLRIISVHDYGKHFVIEALVTPRA